MKDKKTYMDKWLEVICEWVAPAEAFNEKFHAWDAHYKPMYQAARELLAGGYLKIEITPNGFSAFKPTSEQEQAQAATRQHQDIYLLRNGNLTTVINLQRRVYHHNTTEDHDWGRNGSAPADLALNIVEQVLVEIGWNGARIKCWKGDCFSMAWHLHQDFKATFIMTMPENGGVLLAEEIAAWVLIEAIKPQPVSGLEWDNLRCIHQQVTPLISPAHQGVPVVIMTEWLSMQHQTDNTCTMFRVEPFDHEWNDLEFGAAESWELSDLDLMPFVQPLNHQLQGE